MKIKIKSFIINSNTLDWIIEFVIPWACLATVNILIVGALYKASRKRKSLGVTDESRHNIEVTKCLVIVIVLFFILELPRNFNLTFTYIIFSVIDFHSERHLVGYIGEVLISVGSVLAVLSSGINLYIYILAGKKFRRTFVSLFSCKTFIRYQPDQSDTSSKLTQA